MKISLWVPFQSQWFSRGHSESASASVTSFHSDRGNCHFYGQATHSTTMWQKRNLTAWIGGYSNQDDYAQASLMFFNESNRMIGNMSTIGPVLAADRGDITSLLCRQANGLVPGGTRSYFA
ncbi:unnamed protein product [Adineta ricciae]|uniref:Uncharacterized protein n=1 Tax=Adineta ricciae TaxID=249248 RepID=A0A816AHF6_ADIRI|nr:unnamed protein product [Adineta ricciae]CAF1596915.1 unnamed protein product [Adineta ricciae]